MGLSTETHGFIKKLKQVNKNIQHITPIFNILKLHHLHFVLDHSVTRENPVLAIQSTLSSLYTSPTGYYRGSTTHL